MKSKKYSQVVILLLLSVSIALAIPNPPILITKEAEDGTLNGLMETIWDGSAFNNQCIQGYGTRGPGWSEIEVDIATEADYVIWGRVLGMDGFTNSFLVSVDRGQDFIWDINKNYEWGWERVSHRGSGTNGKPELDPVVVHLTVGKHIVTIKLRERFAKIDRIVLTDSKSYVVTEKPLQWIDLKNPRFAQVVLPGSTVEIKWTSNITSSKVNLDLSKNGGKNFRFPIAHEIANTGSFLWHVPADLKVSRAILKVSDLTGTVYDTNFGFFAIINPNDPDVGVRVTGPDAGAQLLPGSVYFIVLDRYFFNGFVNFSYSFDNGNTWNTWTYHENADARHFWHVPNTPSTKCLFRVDDYYGNYVSSVSGVFTILPPPLPPAPPLPQSQPGVSVNAGAIPEAFGLAQNYPNPFNPQTTIDYAVPAAGHVELRVYDLLGKEVSELVNGFIEPGQYQVQWNASAMPTGVYIYKMVAGQHVFSKKMMLVR